MKHLILAVIIGLTAIGCVRYEQGSSEEKIETCGCNSPILQTDLNGKEFSGFLIRYTDNTYGIFTDNHFNSPPLAYVNTICNPNLLPAELKNINTNQRIEVTYKANFKKDCRTAVNMIEWAYYYIELIEIKSKNQ